MSSFALFARNGRKMPGNRFTRALAGGEKREQHVEKNT